MPAFCPACFLGEGRDGISAVQAVSCIEEDDVVACCGKQSLVHGVVESVVGFADEAYVMPCLILLNVSLHEGERMVRGAAVDDKMLDAGIVLRGNALQGAFEDLFGIVSDGCYGKEGLHAMPDIV